MNLLDSLLDAIIRLDGDALVMHVGEKPYVVTTAEASSAHRGPLSWGQVELSSRVLTPDAVLGMLGQLLPLDQRHSLDELGAIDYPVPGPEGTTEQFTVIAARGGDDVWLEVRRHRPEPVSEVAEEETPPIVAQEPVTAQESAATEESVAPAPVVAIGPPERIVEEPVRAAEHIGGDLAAEDEPIIIGEDVDDDAEAFEPVVTAADEECVDEEDAEPYEVLLNSGLGGHSVGVDAIARQRDAAPKDQPFEIVHEVQQHAPTDEEVDALLAATADALTQTPRAGDEEQPSEEPVAAEPDAEPVVAAEPEPVVAAEPEPVVAAEPELEPEPVVAAEPEPDVAQPEPVIAAETDADALVVTEFAPVVAVERESIVAAEPEPVIGEPEPIVAASPEPAVAADPEPVPAFEEPAFVASAPEPEIASAVAEPEPEIVTVAPELATPRSDAELSPEPAIAAAAQQEPVIAAEPDLVVAVESGSAAEFAPVVAATDVVAQEPEPVSLAPEPEPVFAAAAREPEPVVAREPEPVVAGEPEPVVAREPELQATLEPPPIDTETPEPAVAAASSTPVHDVPAAAAFVAEPPRAIAPEPPRAAAADQFAAASHAAEEPRPVVVPLTRRSTRIEQPPTSGAPVLGIEELLRTAAARGASTMYLVAQSEPMVRADGEISTLHLGAPLNEADIERMLLEVATPAARDAWQRGQPAEWLCDVTGVGRVRALTFTDHRGHGLIFRMIPPLAISADQLGLTAEVQAFCGESEGLVLVGGPRASGKSTLLTAFVDLINRTRSDHVITLEPTIGFVHENRRSFISQREVPPEAAAAAARHALREDPDVLFVEEIRSADVASLALEAADSGRLVFASIQAPSTVAAVERLLELFPTPRRTQMQSVLANVLRGVVSQVLLRRARGGRLAAREVLLNTATVSGIIEQGQTAQLARVIESGRRNGMMPLNDALAAVVRDGTVHVTEAYRKAFDKDALLAALKRDGVDTSTVERLA